MTKKSKAKISKDPQAEREAEKYERPIPSREFILESLAEEGRMLNRTQLAELLGLDSEEDQESLRRRLRAMERDGQIIYTRRGFAPVDKLNLVRGRVIGHPDGFGFLQPDEGGDDLFLSARQMMGVMHGDRVVARITGYDRRGRPEGTIAEVLERAHHTLVGRYYCEGGVSFVVADNKRISQDILIPSEQSKSAENGQFVTVEIVEHPTFHRQAIGHVTEILGDHMAPGMEIDVAIHSHGIPGIWPESVEREIQGMSAQVPEEAKEGRLDLRDTPLVTIDGEDARDFDDAVYCERKPKGWRLLVAIADVSHYVQPDSALDTEASERGNSVYFPERVVPMLPEILSNGLCSINPEVDRLCMVCEMYINQDGEITRSRFHEGVMRSHARLTYDKVAAMLVDGDEALRKQYAGLLPHLEELYALYKVMRKARDARGAIDFDTTETRIVFSESRKIEKIIPLHRNDAHMLIEECMIAANVCAAKFLLKNEIPTLYRVHDRPAPDKLGELREFLSELGLQLRGGEEPEAIHYAELLRKVHDRPDAHLIQTVMLRSLKQALYTPDNAGHFGLALDAYAHFTSPIRRYPDLLVHRAIRHILQHGSKKRFPYNTESMVRYGERCSMTDRRADEATRDVVNWLKCEFMMDKVGEEFSGIISAVTSFGLFIELEGIYVEGLVHISDLDNDYYQFDPVHHRLAGERTGQYYRLGDTVRIRVVRVNLDDRKIDFQMVAHVGTLGKSQGRKTQVKEKERGKEGRGSRKSRQGGTKSASSDTVRKDKKRSGKAGGSKKKASANSGAATTAAPKKKSAKTAPKKKRQRSRTTKKSTATKKKRAE